VTFGKTWTLRLTTLNTNAGNLALLACWFVAYAVLEVFVIANWFTVRGKPLKTKTC
jgi:hypothetical protein